MPSRTSVQKAKAAPPHLFICYAHEDLSWVEQVVEYLTPLSNRDALTIFWDQKILAGEWDDEIKRELARADIVLIVVSIYLLNSSYVNRVEMRRAIQRHRAGRAHVIPLIARQCPWDSDPQLSRFQSWLQDRGKIKPLQDWRAKREQALTLVAQKMAEVIGRTHRGKRPSEGSPRPRRASQPSLGRLQPERAGELLNRALASSAALAERCQTKEFWVTRLRQTITMKVQIDADWSVRYEKSMLMRVGGRGAIVAAPFRVAARADAMSKLDAFEVDARYVEVNTTTQPLLFPTAPPASENNMQMRAFTVVFTPPITAVHERQFVLWFTVPAEFEDTLGKNKDDVLGCVTLQLAHEHTVELRFEVLVSRTLPRLTLQPQFKCRASGPTLAGAGLYDQYVFSAPPVRVAGRLAQSITLALDRPVERSYSTKVRRT